MLPPPVAGAADGVTTPGVVGVGRLEVVPLGRAVGFAVGLAVDVTVDVTVGVTVGVAAALAVTGGFGGVAVAGGVTVPLATAGLVGAGEPEPVGRADVGRAGVGRTDVGRAEGGRVDVTGAEVAGAVPVTPLPLSVGNGRDAAPSEDEPPTFTAE